MSSRAKKKYVDVTYIKQYGLACEKPTKVILHCLAQRICTLHSFTLQRAKNVHGKESQPISFFKSDLISVHGTLGGLERLCCLWSNTSGVKL